MKLKAIAAALACLALSSLASAQVINNDSNQSQSQSQESMNVQGEPGTGTGTASSSQQAAQTQAQTISTSLNNSGNGGAGGAGGVGNGGTGGTGGTANSHATSSSGGNVINTALTVQGDTVTYQAQARDPVSTAYAAPLAAANGTCMGSSSAGAQGIGFGLSLGTTWRDDGCDARYDAVALQAIGETVAARVRLCLKPEIAEAFERAGKPCPSSTRKTATAAGSASNPGMAVAGNAQLPGAYLN